MKTTSSCDFSSTPIPSLLELVAEEDNAISKLLEAHEAGDAERVDGLLDYIKWLRTTPVLDPSDTDEGQNLVR